MKEYPLYGISSLTGILAAVLNTLLILVLDFTVPNYDFVTQYVSEFGVIPGNTSTIVSIWWVLHGLILIVFSIGLNNSIVKAGCFSILGPLFICFYGIFDSIGSVYFTGIVGILQRVFIFAADAWIIVLGYRAFMVTLKRRT